ncbi:hypothetical protein VTI28DRAFT_5048 [Corynascus sepedonium]
MVDLRPTNDEPRVKAPASATSRKSPLSTHRGLSVPLYPSSPARLCQYLFGGPCELRPVELHFEVAEAETENVGTHSGRRDPKPALIGHDHKLDARSLCSPPSNFLWRAPALQI